jgi:hypothetical protein
MELTYRDIIDIKIIREDKRVKKELKQSGVNTK